MPLLPRLPLETVPAPVRGAARMALVAVLVPACESVPPSGVLPALAPPVPSEPPRDALDAAIDAAKAEGLAIPPPPAPTAPSAPVAPAADAAVVAPPAAPAPLVLVGIVPGATPPRTVLALPDGTELVARPGSWIPAAHAVVLGVEAEAVDLARIVVVGQRATLQPERLVPARPPEPTEPEADPAP